MFIFCPLAKTDMGGVRPSGGVFVGGTVVLLAVVSFFLVLASGADEDLIWKLEFDDAFVAPPIPGFGLEMGLDGEVSNPSDEANFGTERTRGHRLVMEDLSDLRPGSRSGEVGEERYRGTNFSLEIPPGWDVTSDGDRYEGNLTLEGDSALVRIGWFEDFGINPESCLRQVIRAYRSEYLRFSVLTAEQGDPVVVGDQKASSLNIYYRYGGQGAQKRIVAWCSPISGRFFYTSFWSSPEVWDENLERFEQVLESFRDEISESYVELGPRPATLDGWGTVLSETLSSYHFAGVAPQPNPMVAVKVSLVGHRVGGEVDQIASEEILSLARRTGDPPREAVLQKLLQEAGYGVAILRWRGAYWVVAQDTEGGWQAISSAAPGTDRGLGTLVGPEEAEWYRGLVVEVPAGGMAGEGEDGSSARTVIEKDCDPPRLVHIEPLAEVNLTWILGLVNLLDRYSYTQEGPDPGSFQRSQVCWALLEREGRDARLLAGYQGHPLGRRMWVVVSHPGEGYVAVDPAAGDGGGLGEIVSGAGYFEGVAYETSIQYSCLHPDRGLFIDPEAVGTGAPG